METFSVVYSQANMEGLRLGTPLMRIYPMRRRSAAMVTAAARDTRKSMKKEPGRFLYCFIRSLAVTILIASMSAEDTTVCSVSAM